MVMRTYIREWRKHRRLTLKRLADRLVNEDGSQVVSYVSLSRIERGEQPYTQPTLEAIASALDTDPASLLMRDPTAPDAIWTIWDSLTPEQRVQAVAILEALRSAS